MKRIPLLSILALLPFLILPGCTHRGEAGFDPDSQHLLIGDDIALANTQYGTVKGFIYQNVYTFLGIPYGADTGGGNRFMPPVAPEPWDDVLPTVWYPASAPQMMYDIRSDSYATFRDQWNYDGISEDCLKLNVWTPGTDDKARPVMVWLHGGGFSSGNGIEQDGYMGQNFARKQDVVFVSLNHRLNSFGFSDFAAVGGEKYKHSGNVGMLDIIFALQWVHDNIAEFGGDPGNVTIMGQSGGGAKVCTIAAMPAAKGLVHKAVALSGSSTGAADKTMAEALGAEILKQAGLQPDQIDRLQQMPWEEYYALASKSASELSKRLGKRVGFSPVADGIDIPEGEFYTSGADNVPNVPMLFCTTTNEFMSSRDEPELENMTREEVISTLRQSYGDNSEAIYEEFRGIFPDENPWGIYTIISSSRAGVVKCADNKVLQGQPVYMAWFNWYPPLFGGRPRAFHCLDISFWFNNTDFMPSHSGGGKLPRMLSEKMAASLAAFMRTGNPNTGKRGGLPEWPEYTSEKGVLMLLNNDSRVLNDPDRRARELMSEGNRK